jgi:DNA (cytosine-5)-methyltransferase 1
MVNGREGQDVIAVVEALADSGYAVGAAVIDAKLFVPQSRPRVFIVAVRGDLAIPAALSDDHPTAWCSTEALVEALDGRRVWWPKLPLPTGTPIALEGCFDASAHDWIAMQLSDFGAPSQRVLGERLDVGGRHLGTIFRRTRDGEPCVGMPFRRPRRHPARRLGRKLSTVLGADRGRED